MKLTLSSLSSSKVMNRKKKKNEEVMDSPLPVKPKI